LHVFNVYLFIFLSKALLPTFVKRRARSFLTICGLGPIEALLGTDYKCGNPQMLRSPQHSSLCAVIPQWSKTISAVIIILGSLQSPNLVW